MARPVIGAHVAQREGVAEVARHLAGHGLLVGTAGNVSVRAGTGADAVVVVTGTGVELAGCRPQDVTVVDLDGCLVEGDLEPTSELALHLGVYADHPSDPGGVGVEAVVHMHAAYSTAIACVLDELPVLHYQQLLLGGAIRVAPYATFGSPELAGHVRAALAGRQAALMANHGSVALGASLAKAAEHAVLLEWLATLHHRASTLGTPRALTQTQQDDVIRAAIQRSYGTTRPARQTSQKERR